MWKPICLLIVMFIAIAPSGISQELFPAPIRTVQQPDGVVKFTFTNSPMGAPFRFISPYVASFFPFYHYPTWGITNEFTNVMELSDSPIGEFAISQSFQKHVGDTISVAFAGNGMFPIRYAVGTQNEDGTIDTIRNLYEWINPDFHGLAIKNAMIYYCQATFDTVFIDTGAWSAWSAFAEDVRVLDLRAGIVDTLFDWFDRVPHSMINLDYWPEMMMTGTLDWSHFNWISFDYDGNLLVSFRTMGFMKLDINTGDVIWWGGLPVNLASIHGFNELNCVSGDCRTRLNHNIKAFPGKPGWYTIFDNGDRVRPASRGLVFSVDGLDMKVEEEYYDVPSAFQGSVDIWKEDTTYMLINVPTIGEESWLGMIPGWINDSTVTENLESRLQQSGSIVKLYDRTTGNVIGQWETDSMNFIYSADIVDIDLSITAVLEQKSDFKVYPNPASDYLTVPHGKYKVYNMNAQFMFRQAGDSLDVRPLPPGQYFVRNAKGQQAFFLKQ